MFEGSWRIQVDMALLEPGAGFANSPKDAATTEHMAVARQCESRRRLQPKVQRGPHNHLSLDTIQHGSRRALTDECNMLACMAFRLKPRRIDGQDMVATKAQAQTQID